MRFSRFYAALIWLAMALCSTGCMEIIAEQQDPNADSSNTDGTGGSDSIDAATGVGGSTTNPGTGGSTVGSTTGATTTVASSGATTSATTTTSVTTGATTSASTSVTSTSASSTSSSSGAGGAGGAAPQGTLTVTVLYKDQTVNHVYTFQDWIDADIIQNTKIFTTSFMLDAGLDYEFNGTTDNMGYWCSGANTENVLLEVRWNNAIIDYWTVPEGFGCNFHVLTAPPSCALNNQDCDNYTSDNPVQAQHDCNDASALHYPGQSETWGDLIDYDCDGFIDPPSDRYIAYGPNITGAYKVDLVDATSCSANGCSKTHTMVWNGVTQAFEVTILQPIAPGNIVLRWEMFVGAAPQWSPYKDIVANNCAALITIQVVDLGTNLAVPFTADLLDACHLHRVGG